MTKFSAFSRTLLPLLALSGAATAQTPMPPPTPAARGPSLEAALDAANTAIATCATNGYKVAVSVVDSAGVPKVLLAADGTHARGVDSSTRKALTALAFKMPTSDVAEKIKTDEALAARLTAEPNLLARAGGMLLKAGDETIGAIGVGGAPGGDKDEACAQAAIDKVKGMLK